MISCFAGSSAECTSIENCNMNQILNKVLLAGDKFMSEMH